MTFPATTYSEAIDLTITASNQLHTVINGDSTTEVAVEDGSKIPSVRKAMVDSLYFKPPIAWAQDKYEDTYNQLREFVDGDVRTWWFAKGATVSKPVLMSTNPATDINWTLWSAVTLNAATYETQKRLAAEAGLNMVGSFLLGATVTNTDDVVFYETDGKYYKWGGDLPKTILAGTNPHLSGGIGIMAWVDSTSYLLKDEVDYNKNKAETDYQSGILSFTTDTGTANAYICTYSPVITSRIEGQVLRFKVANTNTGESTFNDGVGAVPLVGGAHSALQGGELVAGGDAWVQWHPYVGAGSYVLLFCTGAPIQVANGSKSQHAVALGQVLPIASMSNFAAYQSSSQSISESTNTAILFQTEVFDDTSEFDNSTGKFTAFSAGTYIFTAGVHGNTGAAITTCLALYVNGVERVRLQEQINACSNKTLAGSSGPVKLAAGDYVQVYYYTTTAESLVVGQSLTYFSGIRIK